MLLSAIKISFDDFDHFDELPISTVRVAVEKYCVDCSPHHVDIHHRAAVISQTIEVK